MYVVIQTDTPTWQLCHRTRFLRKAKNQPLLRALKLPRLLHNHRLHNHGLHNGSKTKMKKHQHVNSHPTRATLLLLPTTPSRTPIKPIYGTMRPSRITGKMSVAPTVSTRPLRCSSGPITSTDSRLSRKLNASSYPRRCGPTRLLLRNARRSLKTPPFAINSPWIAFCAMRGKRIRNKRHRVALSRRMRKCPRYPRRSNPWHGIGRRMARQSGT